MNELKYMNEHVLVDFIEGEPIVVSQKLTYEEAYNQRTEIWKNNPLGLLPGIVEVSYSQCCSNCEKIFNDKEIVYEIHREYWYDLYCLKCAEEKEIDFDYTPFQIVLSFENE